MAITTQCECGSVLSASDQRTGASGYCPTCGRLVVVPQASDAVATAETPALAICEFLDSPPLSEEPADRTPPAAAVTDVPQSKPALGRMFEALLDPRAIQWILMIGGGLCVLGIVVWLVSKGVFENKLVLAASLGAGTLAILGSGWYTTLRTRYRLAGQALTFLGCVVAPLNLWFYHAQDLVTVDNHLWVGGVICCLMYGFTVRALRDPLFMYACEAGVTLTALLLLADLGQIVDTAWLSLFLAALGLASIHAERAFSPADDAQFPRRRYGLPLFWSGHAQLGAGLAILLGSQLLAWFEEPAMALWGIGAPDNLLTANHLVAAGVWLAGAYAYLYSDFVVRRIGVYVVLAGVSLVMAQVTLLLGFDVPAEGILAAMAVTSVAVNAAQAKLAAADSKMVRWTAPLGWALATVPVIWGGVLHVRAVSPLAEVHGWNRGASGWFVAAMVVVTAANWASAWLVRRRDERSATAYFVLSALAAVVAAAGLLRMLGLTAWNQQAPWLMLVPVAYMVASRLWRGRPAERPLYWVAQGSGAIVVAQTLIGAASNLSTLLPRVGSTETLLLALVFVEATVLYGLGAIMHRRGLNLHAAMAAACGALWQMMGYLGVDSSYYAMLFAGLGVILLVVSRVLGLEESNQPQRGGGSVPALSGAGLPAYQAGNAVICVALLAAFLQGLAGLAMAPAGWTPVVALAATVAAGVAAAVVAPSSAWRRFYGVASVALAAVTMLRFNLLLDLTGWQKLEVFCVAVGSALLVGSHVAAFREADGRRNESVSVGLGLGSLLATVPLAIAVFYHRFALDAPSLGDELALLTVTILMTVTGAAWQVKSTTLSGGATLVSYLAVLVWSLAYHPQVAVGVYLAAGGAVVFAVGVALSVYREKLLQIPERAARREGVFRILNWR